MLTIKVEAAPGDDLRHAMVEMMVLANQTHCVVELRANGTTFRVRPADTAREIHDAFDRLYPKSSLVATWVTRPFPRESEPDRSPPFPGAKP